MKKTFDRNDLDEKDWENTNSKPHTNLARFQLQYFSDEWLNDFKIEKTSRKKAYKTWVFNKDVWCEKDIRDDFFCLPSEYYLNKETDDKIRDFENNIGLHIREYPYIFSGEKPKEIANENVFCLLLLELLLLTFLRKEGLKQDHSKLVSKSVKENEYRIGNGMYYEKVIEHYLFSGKGIEILFESFGWEIIISSDPFRFVTGNRPCIEYAKKQTEDHETIEDRIRSNSMILFPVSSFCCLLGLAKDISFGINSISKINTLLAAQCDRYIISSQKGFPGDEFVKNEEYIKNFENPFFRTEIAFFSENCPDTNILEEDITLTRYKI